MFIKVCGITSEQDALLAAALGADAVGFVFAPSSRQVAVDRVRDIARRLPAEVLTVGVFRNEVPDRVVHIMHRAGLGAAQLHGNETPEQSQEIQKRVPRLIKAFASSDQRLAKVSDYHADVALIDSPQPGSGQAFDWNLIENMPLSGVRVLLAGGLDADNVSRAIHKTAPWGVDVSSGVERLPGSKDPVKMRRFIDAARRAFIEVRLRDRIEVSELPYNWKDDI
ncbi:MAG: phosphoribosylanthranilate isomerase [Acidimicrobiia bacterium]|nr:phosphoribosylanthranilate isomerase [Acidimicrobiia bacterium]MCY4458352.1 phosphoribosylanthranilate isomerase [Acidimicrobiaceae bacterium]